MRNKYNIILACLLTFTLSGLYAQQDTLYLTLDDALELAKAQSADAMNAKHRFRMNYWQYRSFKADYLPSVTLDASLPSFSRSYRPVTQPDGSETYEYNTVNYFTSAMTINQKIGPTGGSVYLRSSLQRQDNIFDTVTSSSFQSTPVVIGYTQPIFKYNEYRWARQLEPIKYEKAKRQYLEDVEQVAINTVDKFFNLLLAQIEIDIARKNLNNYDTMYRIAKGRYQLGKIAETDLLMLELSYLRAKSQVDRANLDYENQLFNLKSFLRIKNSSEIKLIPPGETWHGEIKPAEALDQAKMNTSTFLEFKERQLNAESQVRQAKMNERFDADLYLEYGFDQSAAEISEVYQDPLDRQVVNLGLSVPILDWGKAKGQIKMAESQFELVQTSVEQENIDAEQNVFLRVMEFNMQKDQLFIAAKSDTVAQKRYDVTRKRYMIGQTIDILELNDAQIANDNEKKGYYSTLQQYWKNYFELRKMTLYDFMENKLLIFDIREVL